MRSVLPVFLALAAPAFAQQGKVTWRTYADGVKAADKMGQPMFIFFGCPCDSCTALGDGAFSDKRVTAAAANLVPVYVDIKSSREVCEKYGVTKPSLVFAAWNGERLEEFNAGYQDAKLLAKKIAEMAETHRRDLPWSSDYDGAIEAAAKDKKLVAVSYAEQPEDEKVLREPALWPLLKDFVWVRAPWKKGSDAQKQRKLKSPTILILDPEKKAPEESPLLRIEGKKNAATLLAALKEFLDSRRTIK